MKTKDATLGTINLVSAKVDPDWNGSKVVYQDNFGTYFIILMKKCRVWWKWYMSLFETIRLAIDFVYITAYNLGHIWFKFLIVRNYYNQGIYLIQLVN